MKIRMAPVSVIDDPKNITVKGGNVFPDRVLQMDTVRVQFVSDDPEHRQGFSGVMECCVSDANMKALRELFDPSKRLVFTIEEDAIVAQPGTGRLIPLPQNPAAPPAGLIDDSDGPIKT